MRVIAVPAAILALLATPAFAATVTPDVVYGHKDGMALVYDVFQPEQANGAAVLYMVSGGWFSRWQPPERRQLGLQHFLDAGFTTFAVHHGSAPRYKVPDAVADVRRAVRHIRANAARFGVDAQRFGVFGGSAGGHLSLMLGLASDPGDPAAEQPVLRESNAIQAVVAYFPPVDLSGSAGPNERFPALDFDPAQAADISPINFVSDDDPPVLLIHGDADELVPIGNSERMNAALTAANVTNEMVVIEGAAHGFRGPARERAQRESVAFFTAHLAAP